MINLKHRHDKGEGQFRTASENNEFSKQSFDNKLISLRSEAYIVPHVKDLRPSGKQQ